MATVANDTVRLIWLSIPKNW